MNAPAFVTRTHNSDKMHICLGVDPRTLCDVDDIESSAQVNEERLNQLISERDFCDECDDIWESVREDVSVERTVECHRCNNQYSAYLSRSVESMSDGVVPICRPCYKDLLNNDSGVDVDYSDAEPFFDTHHNRTCDVEKILQQQRTS